MYKQVFLSILSIAFLGCSTEVKSSEKPIVKAVVIAAVGATILDLITGQEGSFIRTGVGLGLLGSTLTEKDNEFTVESCWIAAAMIGNHVHNIRKKKYSL